MRFVATAFVGLAFLGSPPASASQPPSTVAADALCCNRGEPAACLRLGWAHARGEEVPKDLAKAVQFYERACDGGHAEGCFSLGLAYARARGVAQDKGRAAALYQKSCDAGFLGACTNLGVAAADGDGVAQDLAWAARLYQRSCEGGSPFGCNNLGAAYAAGRGVPEDDAKAAALYDQACGAGVAAACANLAQLLELGEGIPRDQRRAALLYGQACDGGEGMSCYGLWQMYVAGEGVEKDAAKAAEVAQKARGPLERQLADSALRLRLRAARALIVMDPSFDARMLPIGLAALRCGDPELGFEGASFFDLTGPNAPDVVVDALAQLVRSAAAPDVQLRGAVALALARPPRAAPLAPLFRRALKAADPWSRRLGALGLGQLGSVGWPAYDELKALESDPDTRVQQTVERAARSLALPSASDVFLRDAELVAICECDQRLRAYVYAAPRRMYRLDSGDTLADGRITAISETSFIFEGEKVRDDLTATRYVTTVPLFGEATPEVEMWPGETKVDRCSVNLHHRLAWALGLFADISGLDVAVERGVSATVTLAARRAPWDGLLERLLEANDLGHTFEDGILRVGAKARMAQMLPLVGEHVGKPVSFAFSDGRLEDIVGHFEDLSGLDFELPAGPFPPVTVFCQECPWDQLLGVVAASSGLRYTNEEGRVRLRWAADWGGEASQRTPTKVNAE